MRGFKVIYRNYGHWDIWQDGKESGSGRIFRIRGGPGAYYIIDERELRPHLEAGECKGTKNFKTVQACMGYITDELMFELIIAKGQEPIEIESWNI